MNKFMSQNNDNKTRICLQQKYVSSATAINNENFAQKNKINQNSCKTKKKKEIKVEMTLLFWEDCLLTVVMSTICNILDLKL